jgi:hypothetical protein
MIQFAIAHPYLSIIAAVYLATAILGWMFIAGAAIASREDKPAKFDPIPLSPEQERAVHRAAVEAGYADLAGYVEKYGSDNTPDQKEVQKPHHVRTRINGIMR